MLVDQATDKKMAYLEQYPKYSGDELCSIAVLKTPESEYFFFAYTMGVLNARDDSLKISNNSTVQHWTVQHWKSIYVSYLERHPEYKYMNAAHSIRNALREFGVIVDKAPDKKKKIEYVDDVYNCE